MLQPEEAYYAVEKIYKHRLRKATGEREYWVSWEGYPRAHNRWVSESSLQSCSLLAPYKKKNGLK